MSVEDRLRKLESQFSLLISIADSEKYPFICSCLDADLDTVQVDNILTLISKTENALMDTGMINYDTFEEELSKIVPKKEGINEFPKVIIRALNKENKFILPYKKFKEQGIDI